MKKYDTGTGLYDINGKEIKVGDKVKSPKAEDPVIATVMFGKTTMEVHIYAEYSKDVEYVGLYLDGLIGCEEFLPNSSTMLEIVDETN